MAKAGRLTAAVAALGLSAVGGSALADRAAPPPPGATARCVDGTYSFSQHHSGTCSHHGGVAVWLDVSAASPSTGGAAPAAPTTSSPQIQVGKTVILRLRTKSDGCILGPNPDRRCSPGAYYSGLTKAVICSRTFHTSDVRNVPQSEKFAVEKEYGMTPKLYGR